MVLINLASSNDRKPAGKRLTFEKAIDTQTSAIYTTRFSVIHITSSPHQATITPHQCTTIYHFSKNMSLLFFQDR